MPDGVNIGVLEDHSDQLSPTHSPTNIQIGVKPLQKEAARPQEDIGVIIEDAYEALDALESVYLPEFENPNTPTTYEESRALMEKTFIGWDRANTTLQEYLANPEERERYPDDEEEWYGIRSDFFSPFHAFLKGSISNERWQAEAPFTNQEIAQLQGYGVLRALVEDEEFSCNRELGRLLLYDMKIPWKQYKDAQVAEPIYDVFYVNYAYEYEKKRSLGLLLLQEITRSAVSQGNFSHVREIFDGLAGMEDQKAAVNILFDGNYSDAQRLQMFVQYINVFGFINTIDTLSHAVKNYPLPEETRLQLQSIYGVLQGDAGRKIMTDLSEVYKSVDFHEYTLNSKELTQHEADLLDGIAQETMRKRGITDRSQLHLVDIGAGTGRLSKALLGRGYENVIAFESEPHHVEKIRETGIQVVQGDWNQLTEILQTSQSEDVVFSFGRTISHNRTPADMFHFIDEVQDVLGDDGVFTFDQPNVNWGVYKNRIANLRNNLSALGVENRPFDLIYDGPDEDHKFNRMVLRPEQIDAYARLIGFRPVMDIRSETIQGEDIRNLYYTLELNPDFNPRNISHEQLVADLKTVGLFSPETDFNIFIKSWGMTLGQALVFDLDDDLPRMYSEMEEMVGLSHGVYPQVIATFNGRNELFLETFVEQEDNPSFDLRITRSIILN